GVGGEQVVQGVPAGGGLDDQVGPGQLGYQRTYPSHRQGGEAGRGRGGDVGAGMQAEQPEQPRRVGRQCLVGPGEHGADVGGGVAGRQGVQASGTAQLVGQGAQGQGRMGGGAGGDDGAGQGPAAAR